MSVARHPRPPELEGVPVEEIMQISSRLVVNQAALKLKRDSIRSLIDAFASAIVSSS